MGIIAKKVETQLPSHIVEEYTDFVSFLKIYYDFDYENTISPENFLDEKYLSRGSQIFLTSDGQTLVDDNDRLFLTENKNQFINEWLEYLGFIPFENIVSSTDDFLLDNDGNFLLDSDGNFLLLTPDEHGNLLKRDSIRFIKRLKHFWLNRGSRDSFKYFFKIFFNEVVEVTNTKQKLATPDWGFKLDDPNYKLRDDNINNEFTYVLNVSNEIEYYEPLFTNIFVKYLHPAGFKYVLNVIK